VSSVLGARSRSFDGYRLSRLFSLVLAVIKVTADGCLDTLYCGLVAPTFTEEAQGESRAMLVYPNPASSSVTIGLGEGLPSGGLVVFYNAQGVEVLRETLPAGARENTFSVEGLPTGLYYIEVRDNGQDTVRPGRLIVDR